MKEMVVASTMPAIEHRSERKVTYKPKEKVGFKGVFKCGRKFKAQIQINRVRHYLGLYDTEMEAARAYDEHARNVLGPKARLNLPTEAEKAQENGSEDSDGNSETSKPKCTPTFSGVKLTRHYAVPGSKKSSQQAPMTTVHAHAPAHTHAHEPAMYAHHYHGMPMQFPAMSYAQAMAALPHGTASNHPAPAAWAGGVPSSSGNTTMQEMHPAGSIAQLQEAAAHAPSVLSVQEQLRFFDQYQMMQAYMMSRQPFLMQYPPGTAMPYQYVSAMPANFAQFPYDARMGMPQQAMFQGVPGGQFYPPAPQGMPQEYPVQEHVQEHEPAQPEQEQQQGAQEEGQYTGQGPSSFDTITITAKTPTVDVDVAHE